MSKDQVKASESASHLEGELEDALIYKGLV
jgi:hypothetical protein